MARLTVVVVAAVIALLISATAGFTTNAPMIDLGGATVTIGHTYTGNHSEAYMQEGTEQYARRKQVEQMFNCKIDIVVIPMASIKTVFRPQ